MRNGAQSSIEFLSRIGAITLTNGFNLQVNISYALGKVSLFEANVVLANHSRNREDLWKLIEFVEDEHVEIYNVPLDPDERSNFASSYADKAADLVGKLRSWRERLSAKMPLPNPRGNPAMAEPSIGPLGCTLDAQTRL